MSVLPQYSWPYTSAASPPQTMPYTSAGAYTSAATFGTPSIGLTANTFPAGYSSALLPQVLTTPSMTAGLPTTPSLTTRGSFMAPLPIQSNSLAYGSLQSPTQFSTTALQSPTQFSTTAQWNSGTLGPLNATAMPAFASQPAVGSQSPQYRSLEENNKLRDQGIAKVFTNDPTEQDSDLMERMADGKFFGCGAAGEVPLVSLGSSCGPKLSFKDIGRGAETLPFDWARTRMEGVLQFISTGFAGFFDTVPNYIQYNDEGGKEWKAHRGPLHSFWHDDPTAPAMRERYSRRIKRFFEINATYQPVLFVRAVAATTEVPRALELLQLLKMKFGPQAKLLLIVDFQGPSAIGLARLAGYDNLLLCALDTFSMPSQAAPYGLPIQEALKWAIGQPIRAVQLSSMQEFQARLVPTDWGFYGAAGQPAFV